MELTEWIVIGIGWAFAIVYRFAVINKAVGKARTAIVRIDRMHYSVHNHFHPTIWDCLVYRSNIQLFFKLSAWRTYELFPELAAAEKDLRNEG